MAIMYFSKFNINSKIYDVYENPDLQNQILEKVFNSINNDQIIDVPVKKDGEESEIRYKFCDIIKDINNRNIVGRFVKIFDGESQSYDSEKDTVKTVFEEDRAASSTFCFDFVTEEIAFITRFGLGYRQFNSYFKQLIETSFPEDSFEICLESNIGHLKEKLKRMARVLKVESVIIPPNANEEEFDTLFGTNREEFQQSGATYYTQGLQVTPKSQKSISLETGLVRRMLYGVAKGYGKLIAKGRDYANTNITITSDDDAPYTIAISEKVKDSLIGFRENALPAITQLISDKSQITLESAGDFNEDKKGETTDTTE